MFLVAVSVCLIQQLLYLMTNSVVKDNVENNFSNMFSYMLLMQHISLGMECEDVEERKKMKKKRSKRKAQERARQEKQRVQMAQSRDSICLGLQLLGNIWCVRRIFFC